MDSTTTLDSMCSASWQPFLTYVSPAVAALLSATALWVASKARGTSKDAQQISAEARTLSVAALHTPEANEYLRGAPGQRKS